MTPQHELVALALRVESGSGKPCEHCGKQMFRSPKQFPYQWRKIRLCSKACIGHVAGRKQHGDPADILGRLMSRVEKDPVSGCWNYQLKLTTDGYSRIWFAGRSQLGHQIAYESFVAPIPAGMIVCHRCDNRRCVNPDHLFLGTNADNTADRDRKGRQARGERGGRAKLTEAQVVSIIGDRRTQAAIAAVYGVGETAINNIKRGTSWCHIPRPAAALRAMKESA